MLTSRAVTLVYLLRSIAILGYRDHVAVNNEAHAIALTPLARPLAYWSNGLPNWFVAAGGALSSGGIDCRYAHIARRSASVIER